MNSDNGKNFTGAEPELGRLFSAASNFRQEVRKAIAKLLHLVRVISNSKLMVKEFSTVTIVIESCLNLRPISPTSTCEEDVAALTPGHFLIGLALIAPAEPFDETNKEVTACSRWKMLILTRNHFWKR